jgi:hypothetical protein
MRSAQRFGDQRGVALVAALAVMILMAAASMAFVMISSTETNMVVSQRIEQAALWNAEAGVEVARQTVSEYAMAKLDSMAQAWSGTGPIITDVSGFFPAGGFVHAAYDSTYSVSADLVFLDSSIADSSQVFNFRYIADATGYDGEYGEKRVQAEGVLRVSASRGSFTDYLIFTDVHTTEWGSAIWFHTSGSFDGRVHSNGQYRFAYFPTFYDQASSVAQTAVYYNDGDHIELDDDHNGTIDVPNFYGGFQRDAPSIDMPENSFGQQRAALGGDSGDTSPVSNTEARGYLGLTPSGDPVPEGVYVPNNGSDVTGGIYVAGDAREYRVSVDAGGNQVYQIQDMSYGWTTITVDRGAGTTTVVDGGGTTVLNGAPRGVSYTDGDIRRFGGPERSGGDPQPGIASETQITIVASEDISIDRDIHYQDFEGADQVLGIYSSEGSIKIRTDAPDDLVIDGYVMAGGDSGVFCVEDYWAGDYRGQVHLRGGVVQHFYGAFGTFSQTGMTGYGRDWRYDRRGLIPPYYPTTTRFTVDEPAPAIVAWRED